MERNAESHLAVVEAVPEHHSPPSVALKGIPRDATTLQEPAVAVEETAPRFTLKRIVLAILGTFFVVLGVIGALLPVLPTTPFLLVAAVCYGGSSPRLYARLLNAKYFGEFVRNYQEGTGVNRQTKQRAIFFLWIALAVSACIFRMPLVWGILLLVGICVSVHIATIKPKRQKP